MAEQTTDAASVRLGGLGEQSHTQLNGFKMRALRASAPAQRHLYVMDWHSLDSADVSLGSAGSIFFLPYATIISFNLSPNEI